MTLRSRQLGSSARSRLTGRAVRFWRRGFSNQAVGLFASKRNERVDGRGSPSWEKCRDERHNNEQSGGRDTRRGIEAVNAEEHRRQQPGGRSRGQQSDKSPSGNRYHGVLNHQPSSRPHLDKFAHFGLTLWQRLRLHRANRHS